MGTGWRTGFPETRAKTDNFSGFYCLILLFIKKISSFHQANDTEHGTDLALFLLERESEIIDCKGGDYFEQRNQTFGGHPGFPENP